MYLQYIQSSRHIHVSMVTNKSHFISNKSNAKRIKLKLNSTMQIDWFIIDRWIVFISLSYFKLKCTDIFQNTWIDSSTLFYWLKNEHKIHKPYVQRRLEKMRDVTIDFGKQLEFAHGRLDPRYCNKGCYTSSTKVLWYFFPGPEYLFSQAWMAKLECWRQFYHFKQPSFSFNFLHFPG